MTVTDDPLSIRTLSWDDLVWAAVHKDRASAYLELVKKMAESLAGLEKENQRLRAELEARQ